MALIALTKMIRVNDSFSYPSMLALLGACGCATLPAGETVHRVFEDSGAKIESLIADARPGDVIRVLAGEYRFKEPLKLVAKGNEKQPIRFACEKGRAIFD